MTEGEGRTFGRVQDGNLIHAEACDWAGKGSCTCGLDAAYDLGAARVRERVEAVLDEMEPGAIAPIVAIRAALAEPRPGRLNP